MNFNDICVKSGFELMALVRCDDTYHAIIHRNTSFEPYIFCYCYDVTDGTWGQGHYYDTYAQALEDLKAHL